MGEKTQLGGLAPYPKCALYPGQRSKLAIDKDLCDRDVRWLGVAHGLPYQGCGRAPRRSDWVIAPSKIPFLTIPFGAYIMSWTKPEAEVVAVTMEVTAYVATL